jgi:hypothetical protein
MRRALSVLFLVAACSPSQSAPQQITSSAPPVVASSAPAPAPKAMVIDAGIDAAPKEEETASSEEPDPSYEKIVAVLGIKSPEACASMIGEAKIRCAIDARWAGDAKAQSLANELWAKWRIIPGVEAAHTMDGGYRGNIRLAPAVPINDQRKHVEWIVAAMRDMDQFFDDLAREGAKKTKSRYRFKPIELRFMKSLDGKRTPSAYAHDWTVAWNLEGSLHTSIDAVRETLVHEIFHLNDRAHGSAKGVDWWSANALGKEFDFAVQKCGTSIPCLTPFTPNETIVRGGTYYSYQPGNGVVEYAAELALRYYREQRAVMRKLPKVKPFKCGPPQNARAWESMKNEFFDGIDLVPACPN